MPIRQPVFDPPFNIVRSSHVELGVRDLGRSRAFYVDCLGLLVSDETADALYLRGVEERNHHSLVLRRSREPDALVLGFKLASDQDVDRAAFWFGRRNLPTSFPDLPHQGRTLRTADVFGMPLEFYAQMEQTPTHVAAIQRPSGRAHSAHRSSQLLHAGRPAELRLLPELGFRLTEYTETDGADPKLWGVWMHRKGNVHDIAFTNGAGPRLHHIGLWTPGVLDIIHICDVMATSGYLANMERGPGRHGISNAFFLYIRDPDGHRIELFTSDYLTVDPDHAPIRWSLTDPRRQTLWGHPAPASWFTEGSAFSGVVAREPVLEARPIVAM